MAVAAPSTHPLRHPSECTGHGLSTAVEGALWSYAPLRLAGADLTVTAREGVVGLMGNVRTNALKVIAARIVAAVPGVSGVANDLVSDTDVEAHAASALVGDPDIGTTTDQLTVKCFVGLVRLGGQVVAPDLALAEAAVRRAESVVAALPGVRAVVNQVQARQDRAAGAATPGVPVAATSGAGPEDAAKAAALADRLAVWRERAVARL
jgi:osmotically-inducible protein OsmY